MQPEYPKEFRRTAAGMVIHNRSSVSSMAKSLGLTEDVVTHWVAEELERRKASRPPPLHQSFINLISRVIRTREK